ncbi:FG-GAP-like repeat-containing protein [Undibacterium crateris]|uniref:FG-GAP-like repeat-containing protein n=1 Tax=Undibacterium crateris TaxID=2528175 RepID=UPI00138A2169|nr:FG-GAP-like repeat-containing protein [Undibacterium crateris]NDI87643.1 hypothetical protein [Undibacterium crateris]
MKKYLKALPSLGCSIFLVACGGSADVQNSNKSAFAGDSFVKKISLATTMVMSDVYVAAHQDDDLIFMNPDVKESIAKGNKVSVIYLTSGSDNPPSGQDNTQYWQSRLNGEKAAYSKMAGVANSWNDVDCNSGTFYSKHTLNGSNVTLYTFSMPNSFYNDNYGENPSGMNWTHGNTLHDVWYANGNTFTLNTSPQNTSDSGYADGGGQFNISKSCDQNISKQKIIDTISSLFVALAPDRINTLDHSRLPYSSYTLSGTNFDHEDHVLSAMFAVSALENYRTKVSGLPDYRSYRTYNTVYDANVFEADDPALLEKCAIFNAYTPFDRLIGQSTSGGCNSQYSAMLFRNNKTGLFKSLSTVSLRNQQSGSCLNSSLSFSGCSDVKGDGDRWTLASNGQLQSNGKCLTSGNSALSMATCLPNSQNQIWHVFENGEIKSGNAKCLDGSSGSLSLAECTTVSQKKSSQGGVQVWDVLSSAYATVSSQLGDTGISTSDPSQYESAVFGKITGSTLDDLCYRKSDGLYCVGNDGSGGYSSKSAIKVSSEFSDVNGWNDIKKQKTIRLADINGDGKADLCAVIGSDLGCFLNTSINGSISFSSVKTTILTNLPVADIQADGNYKTLSFADINGDGKLDLCYRTKGGVSCYLNKSTSTSTISFSSAQLVNIFGGNQGWNQEYYGGTVMFADVDGDGIADVCGRGSNGFFCARSTSNANTVSFETPRIWTQLNQLSDAQSWNTLNFKNIKLADINGDGRADLCIRDSSGISCALSSGTGFGFLKNLTRDEFSDKNGWGSAIYASTMIMGNPKDAKLASVCMRGYWGLSCTNY